MEKINLIPRIKELFDHGGNIIQFLREVGGSNLNTTEDILISYDFQAGSYVKFTKENPDYNNAYTKAIAGVLNELGNFRTLLEVGSGEATTLANVASKLRIDSLTFYGFDISWSRINCGVKYLKEKEIKANLFVSDLFNMPFPDNSIDVLYTSHSLEPNGGKEDEALAELHRVAKKYLVLFEPTNEFASEDGKNRMKRNGYIQDLKGHIEKLGYNLVEYRPFEITANPLNPTGLYIIKKEGALAEDSDLKGAVSYSCPISKTPLREYSDHYFSDKSLLSYPKVMGIPCLCSSYAILTTKHD